MRSRWELNRLLGAAACGLLAMAAVAQSSVPALAGDDEDYGMEKSWSDKIGDSISETMKGAQKAVGLAKPTPPPTPEAPSGCPTIAVLDGTQAQRVMAPGATGNEGLRYQFAIYNVGRECTRSGGRIGLKVGADGRVLLGPVGAPGHFDVPIRVVVFDEAAQKPIESKLYRVPVNIPGGGSAAPFQFVSDTIGITIPGNRSAADYSIKVGLDGAKGMGDAAPKGHRRHATRSAANN